MISKVFGFVTFFASAKASSVYIHLSCLLCMQSVVLGVWSLLFCGRKERSPPEVSVISFLPLKFIDILSTVWDLILSYRWTDRTSALGIFRHVRKTVRKATVSFNIFLFSSVRLPSTWNNMAPNGPIFIKFDICITKFFHTNSCTFTYNYVLVF
jgi:hypothetical protein